MRFYKKFTYRSKKYFPSTVKI